MRYNFTIKRAREIQGNLEEAKKEAEVMKSAFDLQGNENHSLEMSANYNTACMLEDVFYNMVVPEYKKLININK